MPKNNYISLPVAMTGVCWRLHVSLYPDQCMCYMLLLSVSPSVKLVDGAVLSMSNSSDNFNSLLTALLGFFKHFSIYVLNNISLVCVIH